MADRREARSAKRNEKKQPSRTCGEPPLPCFFRLVILFVSITDDVPSASSRNETERRGRISVWSVSVSRAVQRGSGGARSSASEENKKTSRRSRLFPRRRRFRVCVTKEGLSAPDRSSEKSANAFLMSGAERRREERVAGVARKNKKNANREG